MRQAQLLVMRQDNPAAVVPSIKIGSDDFPCWTEEEIVQYVARWPLGARERLAMTLLLYTGVRRFDMVKLGRQHRQGDRFILRHEKNKSDTSIRILPQLGPALDAMEDKYLTYLVTHKRKPFEPGALGTDFVIAATMRDCHTAPLTSCASYVSPSCRIRCDEPEGQGSGRPQDRCDVRAYADAANRAKLADEAMEKVASRIRLANRNGKPEVKTSKNG